MRELQPVLARRFRLDEGVPRIAQQISHKRIFAHREAMVIGDGFRVVIGVMDNRQGHQGRNLAGFPPVSTYAQHA